MLKPSLPPVATESFCLAELEDADDMISIKIAGNCEMETTPLLDSFLTSLHVEALARKVQRVSVDCHELYFMNSASIKSLLTWVDKVRESAAGAPYRIGFVTNKDLSWQKRSLGAIQRFASNIVTVD